MNRKRHNATLGIQLRAMILIDDPRHDKTNKVTVRPAKTRISLSIYPV